MPKQFADSAAVVGHPFAENYFLIYNTTLALCPPDGRSTGKRSIFPI